MTWRLIDEGKLRFEQLYDQENKVTVGERIVTSNISEKFVEGLFIGYVSEVEVDSNNLTKTGHHCNACGFPPSEGCICNYSQQAGYDR